MKKPQHTSNVQQPSHRKEVPAPADIFPLDWAAVKTKQDWMLSGPFLN